MHHRPADENVPFEAMCHTLRQNFLVHHKLMTSLHRGLSLKSDSEYITFTGSESRFCICLRFSSSKFWSWSARTLRQRCSSRKRGVWVSVCARPYTCVFTRACVLVCVFQHLRLPMQLIISHVITWDGKWCRAQKEVCLPRKSLNRLLQWNPSLHHARSH